MENKNKNTFDRQLSDRLSNEEVTFDPMAWAQMEEKLDEEPKRFFFWNSKLPYFLALAGLLFITTIYYWPYHYSNDYDNAAGSSTSVDRIVSNSNNEAYDPIEKGGKPQKSGYPSMIDNESDLQISEKNTKSSQVAELPRSYDSVINKRNITASSRLAEAQAGAPGIFGNRHLLKSDLSTSLEHTELIQGTDLAVTEMAATGVLMERAVPLDLVHGVEPLLREVSPLYTSRFIEMNLNLLEVEEEIIRPKHQINFTAGGGMTYLKIDNPNQGATIPVSVTNHEAFSSLSYVYRLRRNLGIETGVRGSYQTKQMAYYFDEGDFDLREPVFAKVRANGFEGKYELFTNFHFYLPLDRRSELDIYVGYYSTNPFETQGSSGGESRFRSPDRPEVNILASELGRETGPLKAGRLNVGLNYSFLTNKRNTLSLGISYMHQLHGDVTGDYYLFQTNDNIAESGKLRANGSGIKVQVNYGFGLGEDHMQGLFKKTKLANSRPWYLGVRYGQKSYLFTDQLSKALVDNNPNQYGTFYLGHYIAQKLAFEVGLEYYQFVFSTPSKLVIAPTNFGVRRQGVISVPFALRRDLIQTGRLLFYGKGVFSTDFRLDQRNIFQNENKGAITDQSRLRLNAGLEVGVDIELFKGLHFGVLAKYNKPFSRLAQFQYPVTYRENEFEFQDINLNNNYFSSGVELKYVFGK